MEQKNEMLTSILASITNRQNLRREWHARFVLLRNGICCPWKMRAFFGEALPDGWPPPSQRRGHEKKKKQVTDAFSQSFLSSTWYLH